MFTTLVFLPQDCFASSLQPTPPAAHREGLVLLEPVLMAESPLAAIVSLKRLTGAEGGPTLDDDDDEDEDEDEEGGALESQL